MHFPQFRLLCLLPLLLTLCYPSLIHGAESTSTLLLEPRPHRYIIFGLTGIAPEQADQALDEIVRFYGPNRAGSNHLYGFSFFQPMIYRHSPATLERYIDQGFQLALKHDMPFLVQYDMLHNPPTIGAGEQEIEPFYNDPEMCEWSDWPAPGESHGPIPRYWCTWGGWWSYPAFPALGSPKLRQLVTNQLQQGILKPVARWRAELRRQEKEYLFAGIKVGWETQIPDYRPGEVLYKLDPENPPVDVFNPSAAPMKPEEMRQLGFNTLTQYGYSKARLEQEAAASPVLTTSTLAHMVLCRAIHDFTEVQAKAAAESGIARDRIFTHGMAQDTVVPLISTMCPPVWTAVNKYATAGFTLVQASGALYNVPRIKAEIALADPSWPYFASSEFYLYAAPTLEQMQAYMGEMFDSGALLIHVLAWHAENPPYAIPRRMEGPHLAIKQWLDQQVASPSTMNGSAP